MRVLDHLLASLRKAAAYNSNDQVPPVCILWPDKERQWETILPRLLKELPELLSLGSYDPAAQDRRTGPAIWLRCAIAGCLGDVSLPEGCTPILYLPGTGCQDLRAAESCPPALKPLVELQYRGTVWSQNASRGWTIRAFLKDICKLDLAQDNSAKNAMQLALPKLLDEEVEPLLNKRLDKDFFNALLTGGDPVRELLLWLDQGNTYLDGHSASEQQAFDDLCQSMFAFSPYKEGCLEGAAKLARHEGSWKAVWERYCEAPLLYPHIPDHIRKCPPPRTDLTWHMGSAPSTEGWPQWNEEQEQALYNELQILDQIPLHKAQEKLAQLEQHHAARRSLVWARLGHAPLALALEHLAALSSLTKNSLAAGQLDELVDDYRSYGWQVDDLVLRTLADVETAGQDNRKAIIAAIRTLYQPWAEDAARHLQALLDKTSYPGGDCRTARTPAYTPGDCLLFVDGLRFDVAKRLVERLRQQGLDVLEEPCWAALPSVTATAKPAVSPVRDKIAGMDDNADFEPSVAETGQSLRGGHHFRRLLAASGWTALENSDNGAGGGLAWCEFGNIDHEGHSWGWKLAGRIDSLVAEIAERVGNLLQAGWTRVILVTDHGWLLLPGGLPKIELPKALTENKWGRCAILKQGASCQERLYPWYWNPDQSVVLADGISCFKQGEEYAHGGLSMQECLTLRLTVTQAASETSQSFELTDIKWKGLRCSVAVDGSCDNLVLDIRTEPGNASSSIVLGKKRFKEGGLASVVVENEDLQGTLATLVITDEHGTLLAQQQVVIGGE